MLKMCSLASISEQKELFSAKLVQNSVFLICNMYHFVKLLVGSIAEINPPKMTCVSLLWTLISLLLLFTRCTKHVVVVLINFHHEQEMFQAAVFSWFKKNKLIVVLCFFMFRFWDLAYPERSYIVAGSSNCPSVSYYRKIIEGTEVVQVFCFVW